MRIVPTLWLAICLGLSGCGAPLSDADVLEAASRSLHERCQASRAGLASMPQAQFDRFCDCSVQKSLDVLGPDGRRKFANAMPWSDADGRNVKRVDAQCVQFVMRL